MKVLHLPGSVGDNAVSLSKAERALGIESDVLILDTPTIFDAETNYSNESLITGGPLKRRIEILKFYQKALDEYDILHFNWGSTALSWSYSPIPPVELGWLKRHGATIAVTYQGSDARQEDYCLNNYEISHAHAYSPKELRIAKLASMIKRMHISAFEKHADLIYATNPDLLNVLPSSAKFRPYTKLDINKIQPVYISEQSESLKVVHAPTDRKKKGTQYLVDAVDRLKGEGYDIELKLIENMRHEEAVREYESADLVVDQLLIGWYGGFGLECMALGKPVMCYIRDSDLRYIPKEMAKDMPLINASPKSVYGKIKSILENRDQLYSAAYASRKYVETWHNNLKTAAGIICDYNNAVGNK